MIRLADAIAHDYRLLRNQTAQLSCVDCGVMPYREAWELQNTLHAQVATGSTASVILLVEHAPVITLGIHKDHNRLLHTEEQLARAGIEVIQTRRGGGSTAHNPGQLVIYPIVNLATCKFRVAPFVHYLEHIAMEVLAQTGVHATRKPRYPGLWVAERKIASVGIQIAQGVSMHGIAINLHNDLGIFDHIVPCGIDGVEMTSSLKEGGAMVPMHKLKEMVQSSCIALLPDYVNSRKEGQ